MLKKTLMAITVASLATVALPAFADNGDDENNAVLEEISMPTTVTSGSTSSSGSTVSSEVTRQELGSGDHADY